MNFIFIKLKQINKLFFKILWFPVDFIVLYWLTGYDFLNKKLPFTFTFKNLNFFFIENIPALKLFYKKLYKIKFFNWWFNIHIFIRLIYIYLFFCFLCAIFYSVYEIHLNTLFEVLAVTELTWVSTLGQFIPETFNSSKEEWFFFMHILWSGLFLFIYFIQLLLFTQLIFCFITIVGYFWLLFLILNSIIFLDMFIPHAHEQLHIAFLHAWFVIASFLIALCGIIIIRVIFIKYKYYNPWFQANFYIFIFFRCKTYLSKFSIKFWKASFFQKIYLILFWSFIFNFGLLFIFTFIKLMVFPASTGNLLWIIIMKVTVPITTWNDAFIYPWPRLFQVFISIAITTLYNLVFFTIALGSFYFLIYFGWTLIVGFILLCIYFPFQWTLYLQYFKFFLNIKDFIYILKKWIPAIREFCYAAVSLEIKNQSFFIKGVRRRRSQKAFWNIYYRDKVFRKKGFWYYFCYEFFTNNISKITGYKIKFQDRKTKNKIIWDVSHIYGAYILLLKRTKGLQGRFWFITKYYGIFFYKRFCFFFFKWKKNPGVIGYFLFNWNFTWENFNNLSLTIFDSFSIKMKILTPLVTGIGYIYVFCLKWLFFSLFIYLIVIILWSVFFPKNKAWYSYQYLYIKQNKIYFFINFCIMQLIYGFLCSFIYLLEYFFDYYPQLKVYLFTIHTNSKYIYEKIVSLQYDDKNTWAQLNIIPKLWALLYLNICIILLSCFILIFFNLNIIGKLITNIWLFFSTLFSQTLLIFLFSPFVILLDILLNILFICGKSIIFVGTFFIKILFIIVKLFGSQWINIWNNFIKKNQQKVQQVSLKINIDEFIIIFLFLLSCVIVGIFIYFFFLCG